jgi:hypothetical protein
MGIWQCRHAQSRNPAAQQLVLVPRKFMHPNQRARLVFLVLVVLFAAWSAPALGVIPPAATSATIAPSLLPNRLGARGMLTFTVSYAGGEHDVPSPVLRSVMRLPAGLSLDIPDLRSCSKARLWLHGASGCPRQSRIGSGHALVEVYAGSQVLTEEVTLWVFLGPPRNIEPTLEILGQGYTPIDERLVLTGTVLPGTYPYGEALELSIPPIPTLPFEPDASLATLSLTIGASQRSPAPGANTIVVPSSCPAGGFPFAAEFTYANGSSGSALATAPCPR